MVVSILDDGIEKDHPDLWANYVSTGLGRGLRSQEHWLFFLEVPSSGLQVYCKQNTIYLIM